VIWDADRQYAETLARHLEKAGLSVVLGEVPDDVDRVLAQLEPVSLLVGELDCPYGSGDLISHLRQVWPRVPLLPVVSRPTVDGAVNAIRSGAVDYLLKKSFSLEELARRIVAAAAGRRDDGGRPKKDELLFEDPRMTRVMRLAEKAAASRATVLIQGESGTGKELLARYIHNRSLRGDKPLVAINCAALPENLLESELFGFEKGAFTGATQRKIGKFEQADGGSLLLDELGELALPLQSKLLRVIQEQEVDRLGGRQPIPVDVRIIATTNRDLEKEVEAGNFRRDLFFRLNVIPLTLPPLRERPRDISLLLERFVDHYSRLNRRRFQGISENARRFLLNHDYPGNVRELENMVERAVVLADGPQLELEDFIIDPERMPAPESLPPLPENTPAAAAASEPPLPVGTTLAEMERYMIYKTLREVNSNRTHAAARLGISIRTLRNKLKEYREKYGDHPE